MTAAPPVVVLDTTLHDLYRVDNDSEHEPTLVYAPFHVYHRGTFTKFIYHAGLRLAQPIATNEEVVKLRLRTTPQRHLFAAGQMPVVILTSSQRELEKAQDAVSIDMISMQKSSSVLPRDQRPNVTFWSKPRDIPLKPGSEIALSRPADCLSHLPHLIAPEVHYEILSKRGLAQSGLPTPPSTVVDTVLQPDEMKDRTKTSIEAARMLLEVEKFKLPFVLKFPQSSGKGTFIISSEVERFQLTEMLRPQLQQMLEQVTEVNHQLHPCSLVLQDYIAGKVVALSLFITRKGRPIFVGCCKQKFNDDGQWTGGSISYAKQDRLHRLYAGSMDKTALFLHQKGYYGPAGIDILTNASGEQYIIDLNVRITGTFNLGLVAGHFTKRGLGRAMVEAAYFSCSRVTFEEAFAREIQDGRIIITAWTYDESLLLSFGVFIIGGSTSVEIKWQLMQVKNYAVLGLGAIVGC
ncbi:hypothetical protein BGZ63DRAFT_414690 [Mariannaea sp. PMI_226]|nr:hypothetical protein BGZ63DRAFT_414690 [Mariannaea sp. PMI_226]